MEIRLTLPIPPSANAIWKTVARGGRAWTYKSGRYKRYIVDSTHQIYSQVGARRLPNRMPFECIVRAYGLPRTRDADNLIKPLLDVLEHAGTIRDDRWCDRLTLTRETTKGNPRVEVVLIGENRLL